MCVVRSSSFRPGACEPPAPFSREDTFLASMRAALLRKRDELRGYHPEMEADRCAEAMDNALRLAANDRAAMEASRNAEVLHQVEDALRRITHGTYGECDECGEPISRKRLAFLPETPVCVTCAERLERESCQ